MFYITKETKCRLLDTASNRQQMLTISDPKEIALLEIA
jgi:hypothetical protein